MTRLELVDAYNAQKRAAVDSLYVREQMNVMFNNNLHDNVRMRRNVGYWQEVSSLHYRQARKAMGVEL